MIASYASYYNVTCATTFGRMTLGILSFSKEENERRNYVSPSEEALSTPTENLYDRATICKVILFQ